MIPLKRYLLIILIISLSIELLAQENSQLDGCWNLSEEINIPDFGMKEKQELQLVFNANQMRVQVVNDTEVDYTFSNDTLILGDRVYLVLELNDIQFKIKPIEAFSLGEHYMIFRRCE